MFYYIILAIVRFAMFFSFRIKAEGVKNIPSEGGVIIAANHRSDLDPVMLGIACPRKLTFMAKAELFKNPVFGRLIKSMGAFPIQRGIGDISAIKGAFSILKSGRVMIIFPEGRRVKKGMESKAQPGVAMIAQRTGAPVVPAYISGDYKWMHKITVTFGEPITLEEYRNQKLKSDDFQKIADDILVNMNELKKDK